MRPKITLVVAAAQDGVIGLNGQLPWHIPEDLKHFRQITTNKPILMGRKTFESIGRPLPNRRNIVLTRNMKWRADGVEVVTSLDQALLLIDESDDLMVIGGEQLYRLALPFADKIELTEVLQPFDGDTYFPVLSNRDWIRIREQQVYSPKEGIYINFVTMKTREDLTDSFLTLKLDDLLQKYGEGKHIPGSGSAAALQGLLAARLVATVVKISLNKGHNPKSEQQFRYIDHQIATVHLPELSKLFDQDINEFNEVFKLRRARDATTDVRKRKNFISMERRRMQNATVIPVAIADHCLKVGQYALSVYREGYRAVRGDSGAAISSACAGALTAAFVIGVNLERFKRGVWHQKWSDKALRLELESVELVNQAVSAVENIRLAAELAQQPEFDLR
ncbi:MAG: hypothetical protein BVN33_08115 [Proteobacteria bacterium ST_bin13]|nr:MAG: hypothetical protein BVN33_08115 [Proteobacteria bacterium ST_bin13]